MEVLKDGIIEVASGLELFGDRFQLSDCLLHGAFLSTSQPLQRHAATAGQLSNAIRIKDREGGVGIDTIEDLPDFLLMKLTFISLQSYADKLTGSFNKRLLRKQTVLRICKSWSEDA